MSTVPRASLTETPLLDGSGLEADPGGAALHAGAMVRRAGVGANRGAGAGSPISGLSAWATTRLDASPGRTRACVRVRRAEARHVGVQWVGGIGIIAGNVGQPGAGLASDGSRGWATAHADAHPLQIDARAAHVPVGVGARSAPGAGCVRSGLGSGAASVAVPDATFADTSVAIGETARRADRRLARA